jgi:hypothetical protein
VARAGWLQAWIGKSEQRGSGARGDKLALLPHPSMFPNGPHFCR